MQLEGREEEQEGRKRKKEGKEGKKENKERRKDGKRVRRKEIGRRDKERKRWRKERRNKGREKEGREEIITRSHLWTQTVDDFEKGFHQPSVVQPALDVVGAKNCRRRGGGDQ